MGTSGYALLPGHFTSGGGEGAVEVLHVDGFVVPTAHMLLLSSSRGELQWKLSKGVVLPQHISEEKRYIQIYCINRSK